MAGLSVVELGDGTAGPYAAKLLGDFGAEVVKIEGPEGDSSRRRGPFPDGRPDPEASGLFLYLNINKFGVDARYRHSGRAGGARPPAGRRRRFDHQPADRAPASSRARAGRASRAASAPDRHHHHAVRLQRARGPDRRGDELVTYAMGGIAYSTPGMPDASDDLEREPPLHPACFAAETITGLSRGQRDADGGARPRPDAGRLPCRCQPAGRLGVDADPRRHHVIPTRASTYNRLLNPTTIGRMPNFYLPCKDGYVTIAAPMDIHWERLVEAMGSPAWALSPDFSTSPARTANWIALRLRLIDWTMTLTGDELLRARREDSASDLPVLSGPQAGRFRPRRARAAAWSISTSADRARQMPGRAVRDARDAVDAAPARRRGSASTTPRSCANAAESPS